VCVGSLDWAEAVRERRKDDEQGTSGT